TQPDRARTLEDLGHAFFVERVADIPPAQAMDYFVAPPFHHGVRMELYRLTPRERARNCLRGGRGTRELPMTCLRHCTPLALLLVAACGGGPGGGGGPAANDAAVSQRVIDYFQKT